MNTKYFFSLEKANAKNKFMTTIQRRDGTVTQNIAEIIDLQKDFYEKLYTSNTETEFKAPNFVHKSISELEKLEIDKPISIDEIGLAIREMPRAKSRGVDGLTPDFYKFFYSRIKTVLLKLYNYCYKVGRLNPSA